MNRQWEDHENTIHSHRRMAIAGVDASFLRPSLRLTRAAKRLRTSARVSLHEDPSTAAALNLIMVLRRGVAGVFSGGASGLGLGVGAAIVSNVDGVRLLARFWLRG